VKPASFTLMTFNVEEYYHSQHGPAEEASKRPALKSGVFETVQGIKKILEAQSPDVICLEEHSMGARGEFSHEDLLRALVGDLRYSSVFMPSGEEHAWYSALSNGVLWKQEKFKKVKSWKEQLATKDDRIPGTEERYTPRSAACVELVHEESGRTVVVCATHLMGGRFEDTSFVAEALVGRNMRAEQIEKIAESVRKACGPSVSSVIAGDFNVMLRGYVKGSVFREEALSYFEKKLKGAALKLVKDKEPKEEEYSFDGFYVPFQTKVHHVLERKLGYISAYGQQDIVEAMKTTQYAGCIDWIYTRHLKSLQDEHVVGTGLAQGLSDHNPVIVTLQWM